MSWGLLTNLGVDVVHLREGSTIQPREIQVVGLRRQLGGGSWRLCGVCVFLREVMFYGARLG